MYDNYKTKTTGAEAFSLYSLKTLPESTIEEDISLYGLQNNSQYIHIKSLPKKGVYISKDVADKYNLKKAIRISLKESYKIYVILLKLKAFMMHLVVWHFICQSLF